MHRISLFAATIVAILALFSFAPAKEVPAESTVSPINQFGFNMFRQMIASPGTGDNVFISPLSISLVLAMTADGADGATREEMARTLAISGMTREEADAFYRSLMNKLTAADSAVQMDIANSIWIRNGLPVENDFLSLGRDIFNARITNVDFSKQETTDIINAWVAENTQNKITEIISPPIPADMVMYLINAIYFKGQWSTSFDPRKTHKQDFFITPENPFPCDMMVTEHSLAYAEAENFQAVALPYGNGSFEMTIVLPADGNTPEAFISSLDSTTWKSLMSSLRTQKVRLTMPKYKIEFQSHLEDQLKAMGMPLAFTPRRADFTGIVKRDNVGGENLYISEVKHKTFIQVDEQGTEAAAVTSVGMKLTTSMPMPSPAMIVDRPFVVFISEKSTGTILFAGKIAKPTPINQ